nr:poly(ADP-ribose) glycohydrolase-like [Cherax quadricarinatus]
MTEYPPRKKLRQVSLLEMLMQSPQSKLQSKNNQSTVNAELDSSHNIQASIECLRLVSSDSAADDIEMMETDKACKETPENEDYKDEKQCFDDEQSAENSNDQERGKEEGKKNEDSDESQKKKKKEVTGEKNDGLEDTKTCVECRSSLSTGPREKNQSKGSTPKKFNKKATGKRSPKRSLMKEKESRHINGRSSERRKILADAAERRMKLGVTTLSDTAEQNAPMSPDMFDDGDNDDKKMGEEMEITWRCFPLSSLTTLSSSNLNLPPVHPAPDHTVMVRLPLPVKGAPAPHPLSYTDVWDQYHVRMPCSPKSQYPLGKGSDSLVPRWSIICQSLRRGIGNVEELQRSVLDYNSRYATKWRFKGLQHLIEQEFDEVERDYFFSTTLPAMIRLALNLPKLVTQAPPLLICRATHSITLSQLQIASLLANAFFCTFPRRNAKGSDTEYSNYPDINFNRLFSHKEKRALEKMKCVLNYFRRVTTEVRGRRWVRLCEKRRFVFFFPKLIISRLFTQALDKTEALIITGAEQFNSGNGYASTFCWADSYVDCTPVDTWGRRMCQVTAIDALHFTKQPQVQYRPSFVIRELNKAYAGFRVLDRSNGVAVGVATGNWGCGAFRGDPRLKSLIQLAVCGYTGRDIAYFTFGDEKLRNDLATMYIFLKENNVTVGELVQVLLHHGSREWSDGSDFFQYIYHNLRAYESETDDETEESADQDVDKKREERTVDSSHTTTKTPKNIADYFKKTVKTSLPSASPSLSSSLCHASTSQQSAYNVNAVEKSRKESLSEDKILQVLTECDRLVGGQLVKSHETSNSKSAAKTRKLMDQDRDAGSTENSRNCKRDVNGREREKNEEKKNTVSTNSGEPSRLLSFLDDIDKSLAS